MRMSWKLGRVSGIDVYLHPTLLLLLLFVAGASGAQGVGLAATGFFCVLLHEFGHALAARRFGIATEDITLYPIGGVARLSRMPRSPGAELVIALAGPAVNLAIAGSMIVLGLLGPGGAPTLAGGLWADVIGVNLILALFNLIPAFPMDGGRVLRALLSGWLGRVRATGIAAAVGRTLAVAFGAYSLVHGMLMQCVLAAFIYMMAGLEYGNVRAEEDRRNPDDDPQDWNTPRGFRWVRTGDGAWQLLPVTVNVNQGRGTYPRWR